MATQEESLKNIGESKGEIRKLSVVIEGLENAIEGLETLLKETADKEEKRSLGAQISDKTKLVIAKTALLTALVSSQQGKFHHIFPLSHLLNLLDVILCPISFGISSSAIQRTPQLCLS